jgi:hypothetical protein
MSGLPESEAQAAALQPAAASRPVAPSTRPCSPGTSPTAAGFLCRARSSLRWAVGHSRSNPAARNPSITTRARLPVSWNPACRPSDPLHVMSRKPLVTVTVPVPVTRLPYDRLTPWRWWRNHLDAGLRNGGITDDDLRRRRSPNWLNVRNRCGRGDTTRQASRKNHNKRETITWHGYSVQIAGAW